MGLIDSAPLELKCCEEFSDRKRAALTKTIYVTKQGYG